MKIIIKIEGEKDKVDMILSNEEIDNPNFIELCIEGEEYTVTLNDLKSAVVALQNNIKEYDNNNNS